ncbi:L-rhamnose mutarotase [Flavobacterium sp.]|uniref:L-rhamnose mutarotase n=1 Tax=Flavobacterium sp. TaxID=239 RepID=UPI0031CFDBFC
MQLKRICYSCDLIDDPELITEYKKYHLAENVRPEITKSIKNAGLRRFAFSTQMISTLYLHCFRKK